MPFTTVHVVTLTGAFYTENATLLTCKRSLAAVPQEQQFAWLVDFWCLT